MKNLSDESFCFCLSSATWACIGWPVIVVDTPEANHCGALGDACFVLDAEGQADFMFPPAARDVDGGGDAACLH